MALRRKKSEILELIDECESPREWFHTIRKLKRNNDHRVEDVPCDAIISSIDQGDLLEAKAIIDRQERAYWKQVRGEE